ncbi:MAG: NAD(+) diphosphatase [Oscillospiraceae bacterium]|nr:NAD(+) diphosphatase [Oscillospiraceae bacterium]
MGPKEAVFAAAVSESLHRWYGANRYCGRCGQPMQDSETERARVCPACGLTVYPKICPAVIVAVTDGDRLLLTKYQGRAFRRYALVAGFAEIGEPIEDTVRREVLEETGLRVKQIRFYKSQPWVFTDSLLLGFWCELDGSDAVTVQESELSEARWHHRDEIPEDYSGISLTGEMIDAFRQGKEHLMREA